MYVFYNIEIQDFIITKHIHNEEREVERSA